MRSELGCDRASNSTVVEQPAPLQSRIELTVAIPLRTSRLRRFVSIDDGELGTSRQMADLRPPLRQTDSLAQWFALWTRSRHEQLVRRELEMRGVEVFLPTVSRWSARGVRRRTDAPLFPGYCFARFELDRRFAVLNCAGVAAIVSIAGHPAPIPESEIDGIRQLIESDLQYDPCPFIREGSMVEVVRGPLRGVVGRLVRKGAHEHLVLSVDIVGSAVSVQVDAADVVAV